MPRILSCDLELQNQFLLKIVLVLATEILLVNVKVKLMLISEL